MNICPYPPPSCPIFMLDEHDGVVSAEPRNEDEDFRLAVQQLLASDDRDDDENTVTGRVQVRIKKQARNARICMHTYKCGSLQAPFLIFMR